MKGRKRKCFGCFTDSDKIHEAYGNKYEDFDVGWDDAGFFCLTLCPQSFECMQESDKRSERGVHGGVKAQ